MTNSQNILKNTSAKIEFSCCRFKKTPVSRYKELYYSPAGSGRQKAATS